MMKNDAATFERAAEHIVRTCLGVAPGEHVWVAGGIHQYDLLSRIALHVRKVGGHPTVHVTDDESEVRRHAEVPEEFLLTPPTEFEFYQARLYDAAIHIDAMWEHARMLDVPSALIGKLAARNHELRTIKYERGRRSIAMAWPTQERADRAGLSLEDLTDLFWRALFVNLDDMQALSESLVERFRRADRVRITSAKGTDLTFSIKGRKVLVDAGQYDESSRANGDIMKNLPCGEVYTTAVEDTVQGVVVFDEVYQKGTKVEDLRLVFEGGRACSSSARVNHEIFADLWANATGDRDRVGEFAIGTNPHVTRTIGDDLFDEKIFGSIHLALGENRMYGGQNTSSIHWDFVVLKPTVVIDGETVLEAGRFLVP